MPVDPARSPSRLADAPRTPFWRLHVAVGMIAVVATACATTVASGEAVEPDRPATQEQAPALDESAATSSPSEPPPGSGTAPATTMPAESTSTVETTAASTTTAPTTTTTTTTTTTDPLRGVHAPACVRIAEEGGFEVVDAEAGPTSLWIENGFRDAPAIGDFVDVCVDNGINDITGDPALRHDDPAVITAVADDVRRQQQKLNELFAPYASTPLTVDGISGPLTGQRLCAARVALGLDPSVTDLQPGSDEHATLLAAAELPTPASTATASDRWVLIDRTCQWMFIGSGSELVFAFPTSTGTEGFETRTQDRADVFRYNPAVDNGGWHDSSEYPVGVDNPLNGNLYKPLYFDLGQAIHGANNVPPEPASKGCARLSVANQERLLDWLGLLDATEETWRKPEMNLTVNVQGEFVPRALRS